MNLLKLNENENQIDDLNQIVSAISFVDNNFVESSFGIYYFDGIFNKQFENYGFGNLFGTIESDGLFLMNYSKFKDFLLSLEQVFDLLIVVDHKKEIKNRSFYKDDNVLYESFEYTISYFDAGFWEISCCKNDNFIKIKNSLKNKFGNVPN
jgi:hypothetical protein